MTNLKPIYAINMKQRIIALVLLTLTFSVNASAVRGKGAAPGKHSPYLYVALGTAATAALYSAYYSLGLNSENLSQNRDKGVTTSHFRYPNLILALAEREKKRLPESEARDVLILGPGIASEPSKSVPQIHELMPFFENDHIVVVDRSRQVLEAVKNSVITDYDNQILLSIIGDAENFSKMDPFSARRARETLAQHVAKMPADLKRFSIALLERDFTELDLKYDSLDVLIATKSLAYGAESEPMIFGRYLTALRKGGVGYFAIDEFQTMNKGGVPKSLTNHFQVLDFFQQHGVLNTVIDLENGMKFQIRTFAVTTNSKDPTGRTWAIWFDRPHLKNKNAFVGTSPIFEFTRLK